MTYDVRAIANFVLEQGEETGRPVTNITINKIVFFLHAWYLARTGNPLVSAKIEAWDYGPVFRELYWEFKSFENKAISKRATRRNPVTTEREICPVELNQEDLDFLGPLVGKYLKMPASKLIELSHVPGGPWDKVYNHKDESNPGMHISNALIRGWFLGQTRH